MIASIEDKTIRTVISSYQHAEKMLVEGSDEHLDLILEIKNDLQKMTVLTRALVHEIELNFNAISKEAAKEAVVKIFPCFGIAEQIVGHLKRAGLYSSLLSTIHAFDTELNELKEFVSDLSRYKVQDNDELIALFNEEK